MKRIIGAVINQLIGVVTLLPTMGKVVAAIIAGAIIIGAIMFGEPEWIDAIPGLFGMDTQACLDDLTVKCE